jgi:hypothetical protein
MSARARSTTFFGQHNCGFLHSRAFIIILLYGFLPMRNSAVVLLTDLDNVKVLVHL